MLKKFLVGGVLFVFIFSLGGCGMKRAPETGGGFIPMQSPASASPQEAPASSPRGDNGSTWDFGRITAGQIMKHEFTLTNDTQVPLVISAINSSCGCTVPDVKKKNLLPGESTAIEVSFNSTGYSGPVEQYVYVHTDRANDPVVKFTIKAEVNK